MSSNQELYDSIKAKRRNLDRVMLFRWKRQPEEQWELTRKRIHTRDRGVCQSPSNSPPKLNELCKQKVSLRECHIDHVRPLSSGGSNSDANLRTLCPACHGLRLDSKHEGMRSSLIKSGSIPLNWKEYVWEY